MLEPQQIIERATEIYYTRAFPKDMDLTNMIANLALMVKDTTMPAQEKAVVVLHLARDITSFDAIRSIASPSARAHAIMMAIVPALKQLNTYHEIVVHLVIVIAYARVNKMNIVPVQCGSLRHVFDMFTREPADFDIRDGVIGLMYEYLAMTEGKDDDETIELPDTTASILFTCFDALATYHPANIRRIS
jgi:hypothetical protein